eukprot:691418-Rhodomonas_salina.4
MSMSECPAWSCKRLASASSPPRALPPTASSPCTAPSGADAAASARASLSESEIWLASCVIWLGPPASPSTLSTHMSPNTVGLGLKSFVREFHVV